MVARELDDNFLRDCVIAMMTRPQGHATSDDELYVTWGQAPFSRSRDSGTLDDSNFKRIHEDLAEEFPDDTGVLHDRHWGFGWLETVTVRVMLQRPGQPPGKLYGKALDAWLASWEYDEARVRALKGAALARWLETRVTPVTRRVAEIILQLQGYPEYDSEDTSRRDLEKAREVFADRWREVLFLWNDDPDDEDYDYDGPPLPEQVPESPGYEEPFCEAWEAFFDGWQASSGETAPPAQALKDVLKESDGYKDWAREQRQVPGQAELDLFTAARQRITGERIAEIRALLEEWEECRRVHGFGGPEGVVNPFQDVIAGLPEFDGEATKAAGYPEHLDYYVLTDGTILDGDGPGWRITRPGEGK